MLDVTGKWGAKSIFEAERWRVGSEEDYLVGNWPSFFLDLPEAERAPFETCRSACSGTSWNLTRRNGVHTSDIFSKRGGINDAS